MHDAWSDTRIRAIVLGTLLCDHRKLNGMSLQQVCDQLDPLYHSKLDAPTLSRIERGTALPTEDQGQKLTQWALQSLPGIDAPVARHSDPDTSHVAAESVSQWTISGVRLWWLKHLAFLRGRDYHQLNLDNVSVGYWATDEGARRFYAGPKTSDSGFRTRRAELVKMGLVEDSSLTFAISTGRDAIAWQITDLGIERLKEIK